MFFLWRFLNGEKKLLLSDPDCARGFPVYGFFWAGKGSAVVEDDAACVVDPIGFDGPHGAAPILGKNGIDMNIHFSPHLTAVELILFIQSREFFYYGHLPVVITGKTRFIEGVDVLNRLFPV